MGMNRQLTWVGDPQKQPGSHLRVEGPYDEAWWLHPDSDCDNNVKEWTKTIG